MLLLGLGVALDSGERRRVRESRRLSAGREAVRSGDDGRGTEDRLSGLAARAGTKTKRFTELRAHKLERFPLCV